MSAIRSNVDYDSRPIPIKPEADPLDGIAQYYRDFPSTHPADKALLVDLGVDGDVPFEQAAINAGLHVTGRVRGVRFATKVMWGGGDAGPELFVPLGANDNHEIAAKAA